jgi:hypothetical protein
MHHEIHDNQLYLQRLAEEKEHLTNDSRLLWLRFSGARNWSGKAH